MPSDWETRSDFPDSKWPDFFHMPVLMLMLITLLNDGTLISIGYDNASARHTPEKWNVGTLFMVAAVMAFVASISSLLLLGILLNSWHDNYFLAGIGVSKLSYGQITTSIYLKVSVSDFLTLFSARAGDEFFWTGAKPALILVFAGSFALTCSTILAVFWPASTPDGIYTIGLGRRQPYFLFAYIWVYCLFMWLLEDAAKVFAFFCIKRFNLFGYNDTGKLVLPESARNYIEKNKSFHLQAAAGHVRK